MYSASGSPLYQVSIASRPPNVQVDKLAESLTQSLWKVSCMPSSPGLQESEVRFRVQLPGNKEESVVVPVSYFGL